MRLRVCAFGLVCSLLIVRVASADFIRTSDGVYQNTDLRTRVLVSFNEPGIFISSGAKMPLQVWSPALLEVDHGFDLFVSYDAHENRYSHIRVGNKHWPISGSLSLKVGHIDVSIAEKIPYLSIVVNDEDNNRDSSIIGFRGLELIVNTKGEKAIALLDANSFEEYRDLIQDYSIRERKLFLGNQEVLGQRVGVDLEIKPNACMGPDAILLEQNLISEVKKVKEGPVQAKLLSDILKKNSVLGNIIVMRNTKTIAVAYDYRKSQVKIIRPIKTETVRTDASKTILCSVETLDLEAL